MVFVILIRSLIKRTPEKQSNAVAHVECGAFYIINLATSYASEIRWAHTNANHKITVCKCVGGRCQRVKHS